MRIALTVHKYPPAALGGTEVYTASLAAALTRAGHTVHVFYPEAGLAQTAHGTGPGGEQLWRVPLPTSRAGENPAAQFWHTFRDRGIEAEFTRFLRATQPDVVHFQHVQGVSARLIGLAAGRPRVATLHDYWYFCANSQLIRPDHAPCAGPSPGCRNCVDCATARADLAPLRALRPLVALPLAYRNRVLRDAAAQIDRFIAPSAFLRAQYAGQGFPSERITVIENGMDLRRLAGEALPAPAVRPHFGFLGALAWQKGVHVLIDAFNRLPPDAASLTIFGSERAFPEYGAQVRALVRHPQIRFAGALPFDAVGGALRSLDALVTPSLWYENSPLVIQEAYAVGVPVIASRLGALEEKVQDGVTGRLFAAGDAAALAEVLGGIARAPEQLAEYRRNLPPPPDIDSHAAVLAGLYGELPARRSSAE